MKTVDFLDALKRQHKLSSDYALAELLGISRQKVSNYRRGADTFGEETAVKVAELGGWRAGYVFACGAEERAERTKRPAVRKAWHEVAKALAPALAVMIGAGGMLLPHRAESAAKLLNNQESVYYVKRRRDRLSGAGGMLDALLNLLRLPGTIPA